MTLGRSLKKWVMGLGCAIILLGLSAAQAGEHEWEISGFVDGSYFIDKNASTNSFGLDQAEVDIEKKITDKASLRVDVEYFDATAGPVDIEQGYMTIDAIAESPVSLTFGKFNAPIGFELLDAPDMYQFSHALVFNFGIPTNLTGIMLSSDLGEMFDISAYAVNGWDANTDNNKDKTFGGRIGIKPMESVSLGLSGIAGYEQPANNTNIRQVFDTDLTVTLLDEKLTLGAEYNIGKETAVGDWYGTLLMVHYDYADWGGITFRHDYFNDADGTRLGSSMPESRRAITFAPTFSIADGMSALIEYRWDDSTEAVFTDSDNNAVKSNSTVAVKFTYTF